MQLKHLFQLTVQEFTELQEGLFTKQKKELTHLLGELDKKEVQEDIIHLKGALEITGYTQSTMYSKICKNEIPVVSRNRPLTFSRKSLLEWLRNGKPNEAERKASIYLKKKKI